MGLFLWKFWVGSFTFTNIMEEQLKEIAYYVGLSTIGILCSYLVSPFIAKELNAVSTSLLNQPLNVDITQKYVFLTLSGIIVGSAGYYCLHSLLDISVQSVLLTSGAGLYGLDIPVVVLDTIPNLINSDIIVINWNNVHPDFQLTNTWQADQMWLTEVVKPVSGVLFNVDSRVLLELTLLKKSFNSTFLLSEAWLKTFVPHYKKNFNYVSTMTDDYLVSIFPQMREYILLFQLNTALLRYHDSAGIPEYHQMISALMLSMDLDNINAVGIRLIEAIKRLGSDAGGVSDLELMLRWQWGHEVYFRNFAVAKFMDGSALLNDVTTNLIYSNWGGLTVDQVVAKSRFLIDINKTMEDVS